MPIKLPLTYRNIVSNSVLYKSLSSQHNVIRIIFFNSFYEVGKSTLQVFTFAGLVLGNGRPTNGISL